MRDGARGSNEKITGLFSAPAGTPTITSLRMSHRRLMDDINTSHPFYRAAFSTVRDGEILVIRHSQRIAQAGKESRPYRSGWDEATTSRGARWGCACGCDAGSAGAAAQAGSLKSAMAAFRTKRAKNDRLLHVKLPSIRARYFSLGLP